MSDRELADRLHALETLAIHLVHALSRTGSLPVLDRERLLGTVEDQCRADTGQALAAEELVEAIEITGGTHPGSGMGAALLARIQHGSRSGDGGERDRHATPPRRTRARRF